MASVYAFIFCQSSFHHNIGIGALYHYVALGKTLSPHIYRISGDDCSIEDIERFINDQFSMFEDREEHDQMLHVVEEPFVHEMILLMTMVVMKRRYTMLSLWQENSRKPLMRTKMKF